VSGRKARERRQTARRERQRQQRAARRRWDVEARRRIRLTPDGVLCQHYEADTADADWIPDPDAPGGGYRVAICEDCVTYLIGADLVALVRELAA
jgi:hypothetical protein